MVHLVSHMSQLGHRKGVPLIGVFGMRNGSPVDEHRTVLRIFRPSSVIICQNSTGVVACVGRSVLLRLKLAECTKKDPRKLLATDENP
jgi:hypothetical protein